MSERALNVALVALGFAAAVLLALFGIDLVRAARTGPKWKRRLLSAGLVLMASLGLAPAGCESDTAAEGPPQAHRIVQGQRLTETGGWKHLLAAWREAEEVASGKRGPYPFDEAGKKRLLADLARADADVQTLHAANLLTEPEAGLLRKDLERLVKGVQMKRPTELRKALCYDPMRLTPGRESLKRLQHRLYLIDGLVAAEELHPEVVRRVLATIEADIQTLDDKNVLKEFRTADEQWSATWIRDRARGGVLVVRERLGEKPAVRTESTEYARKRLEQLAARIDALDRAAASLGHVPGMRLEGFVMSTRGDLRFMKERRFTIQLADADLKRSRTLLLRAAAALKAIDAEAAKPLDLDAVKPVTAQDLAGKALEATDAWKRLASTWQTAAAAVAGRRGPYPFNRDQQGRLLANLAATGKNLSAMQQAGLLTEPEAALLRTNLDTLTARVRAYRPKELQATCYIPMRWPSAQESLKRLAARAPLLEKLAQTQTLRPEVVGKALYTVEADLQTLSDEKMLERLDKPNQRDEALRTRDAARKTVRAIKARLGERE